MNKISQKVHDLIAFHQKHNAPGKHFRLEWGGKPFFLPPKLLVEWNKAVDHEERKASWTELFYDLVYVAAIIRLGNAMKDGGITWGNHLSVMAQYLSIWNCWLIYSLYNTRFTADDIMHKFHNAMQMLGLMGVATHVFELQQEADRAPGFFFSLAFLNFHTILMYVLVRMYSHKDCRRTAEFMIVGELVNAIVSIVCIFLPYRDWRRGLSGVFMMARLALTLMTQRASHRSRWAIALPIDITYNSERMGLQIMILLGESLISLTSADLQRTSEYYGFVVLSVLYVIGLQSLYYDAQPEEPHLHALRRRATSASFWIYLHYLINCSLLMVAVGLKVLLAHVDYSLFLNELWLLVIGNSVYALSVVCLRMLHNGWKAELGLRRHQVDPIAQYFKLAKSGSGLTKQQLKYHEKQNRHTLIERRTKHSKDVEEAKAAVEEKPGAVLELIKKGGTLSPIMEMEGYVDSENQVLEKKGTPEKSAEKLPDDEKESSTNPDHILRKAPSLVLMQGKKISTVGTSVDELIHRRRILWGSRIILSLAPLLLPAGVGTLRPVAVVGILLLITAVIVLIDQFDVSVFIVPPESTFSTKSPSKHSSGSSDGFITRETSYPSTPNSLEKTAKRVTFASPGRVSRV
eukprot:m.87337 g.87337  ORF g.87337 m.87337 type:complete len:631 (+) comp13103_c0_seq1:304-2196(+)